MFDGSHIFDKDQHIYNKKAVHYIVYNAFIVPRSRRLSGVVVPILLIVYEVRSSTPGLTASAIHLLV